MVTEIERIAKDYTSGQSIAPEEPKTSSIPTPIEQIAEDYTSGQSIAEPTPKKRRSSKPRVQTYQTETGKVSVGEETIQGQDVALVVGTPEVIESVTRKQAEQVSRQVSQQQAQEQTKIMGYVEATPQPKWYDVPARLSKYSREKTELTPTGGIYKKENILPFGAGVLAGITQPIFHPVETVKSFGHMILHPVETVKTIGQEIETNPVNFLGETTGQILFFKGASKVGGKTYDVAVEKIGGGTDIKGTITGTAENPVFKSEGIYKGRKFQEVTIQSEKSAISKYKLGGKTFDLEITPETINYQITKQSLKPVVKFQTTEGGFSLTPKGEFVKYTKLIDEGTQVPEGVGTTFTQTKPRTKQDIKIQTEFTGGTKLDYLETTTSDIKASKINDFEYKASAKVTSQAEVKALVTDQLKLGKKADILWKNAEGTTVSILKTDKTGKQIFGLAEDVKGITVEYTKPTIEFSEKPSPTKTIYDVKRTKTGYEVERTQPPKYSAIGKQKTKILGEFTIKDYKPPKKFIPKELSSDPLGGLQETPKKPVSETFKIEPIKTKPKSKETTFDYSKTILEQTSSAEQIAITESAQTTKPTINIPSQTQIPKIDIPKIRTDILDSKAPSKTIVIPKTSDIKVESPTIISQAKVGTVFDTKTTEKYVIKPIQEVDIITKQEPKVSIDTSSKPRTRTRPSTRVDIITEQKPSAKIKQIPITAQIKKVIQEPIIQQKQSTFTNIRLKELFFKQPPTPVIKSVRPFSPQERGGFNVFIKVKGVFKKATEQALSEQDAINFGAYRVGQTASATFKIEPTTQPISKTFGKKADLSSFYRKNELFIEKKEKRIKSIGELQEITYKGIQSQRKTKNIFGGK